MQGFRQMDSLHKLITNNILWYKKTGPGTHNKIIFSLYVHKSSQRPLWETQVIFQQGFVRDLQTLILDKEGLIQGT